MKKKGFTIVELLVVMSIIVVLVGAMIPNLTFYETKAKDLNAVTAGKQIFDVVMCNYSENQGSITNALTGEVEEVVGKKVTITKIAGSNSNIVVDYNTEKTNYTLTTDILNNTFTIKSGDKFVYNKE